MYEAKIKTVQSFVLLNAKIIIQFYVVNLFDKLEGTQIHTIVKDHFNFQIGLNLI